MSAETTSIRVGAAVRDSVGEEVGQISQVWPQVPTSWADGPPEPGCVPPDEHDLGYFRIDRGGGIGGLGATHFFLPFDAVRHVEQDGTVRLTCAAQECEESYCRQPWFADRDIV